MALNLQTFRTRALTAIVFVVVMVAGIFLNQWSFFILFTIIHFGCWIEYLQLIEKINYARFHIYTKIGFMVFGYGLMVWLCGSQYQVSHYILKSNFSYPLTLAGFMLLAFGILSKQKLKLKAFGAATLGILYISLSWGFMMNLFGTREVHIHSTNYIIPGYAIPVIIIASIWINDTMAYMVGSFIGKTPLSKISPKKTWEGTLGGIVLSIGVAWLVSFAILKLGGLSIFVIIIAAIASVAGTSGDLLESKLKRMGGVKDSGSLMPGHGGFLDRFDSLLLATPFVWLYVQLCT